jgi:hypothetical protein
VIGLFLGLVARFYLSRRFVFRRPVYLPDLVHYPLQVFEVESAEGSGRAGDAEPPTRSAAAGERVSGRSTGPSTSGPARQPGP